MDDNARPTSQGSRLRSTRIDASPRLRRRRRSEGGRLTVTETPLTLRRAHVSENLANCKRIKGFAGSYR